MIPVTTNDLRISSGFSLRLLTPAATQSTMSCLVGGEIFGMLPSLTFWASSCMYWTHLSLIVLLNGLFTLTYSGCRTDVQPPGIMACVAAAFLVSFFTLSVRCQPRWLSGLRRSRVHSLVIARRSLCTEKLGSNPGQGSKGINFSGWHGLDMSITVTKRR